MSSVASILPMNGMPMVGHLGIYASRVIKPSEHEDDRTYVQTVLINVAKHPLHSLLMPVNSSPRVESITIN